MLSSRSFFPLLGAAFVFALLLSVNSRADTSPTLAAPEWREDEYARMRRGETEAERAARLAEFGSAFAFNPADYRALDLLSEGLQKAPEVPPGSAAPAEAGPAGDSTAGEADDSADKIRVISEDYLDYDEENHLIYGRSRTTVFYNDYVLKADKLLIDVRLREAEAVGNVELALGPDTIKADSMRFNFDRQEGVAYNVGGEIVSVYFKGAKDETLDKPSFRRVGPDTSVFRDSSITGCDFPIPHYRVRAREMIVVQRDRLYARSALLYVWEAPVGYLPFYTRSLLEHSPWSFIVGYDSELGGVLRTTYDYYYKDYYTDPDDPEKVKRRSFSKTTLLYDYLSDRGHGVGVKADYDLLYDRHRGSFFLYGIQDDERDIETFDGKQEDEDQRYVIQGGLRSDLARDLRVQGSVDWASDSEIHYDILDFFNEEARGRVPERKANIGLVLTKEAWLGRIMFEMKERIGRNRITNFANYSDDDSDFDEDLDSEGRSLGDIQASIDSDDEGLPDSRWGRVTERMPQITFASRWMKPTGLPLFYQYDLNIINNLDKGLNTIDTDDDSMVQGFDFYQALMLALNFGQHSTLVSKVGAGFGYMSRDDDEFNYDYDNAIELPDGQWFIDGVVFSDRDETFMIGKDEYSLSDVQEDFAYGDFETQWTTRFSDYLTGYLRYFVREGTEDSLGEWYRRIGNRLARSDLYDYRIAKHEVTGGLIYATAIPEITMSLIAGYNLRSNSEQVPGERDYWVDYTINYVSPRQVVKANMGLSYFQYQREHGGAADDDNEDEFDGDEEARVMAGFGTIEFFPVSERYWSRFSFWGYTDDGEDDGNNINEEADDDDDNYDESDEDYDLTALVGARIGRKWKAEIETTYDGDQEDFDRVDLVLARDLHDAVLSLRATARKNSDNEDDQNDDDDDEEGDDEEWDRVSFRAALTLKRMSADSGGPSQPQIRTMQDDRRRSAID